MSGAGLETSRGSSLRVGLLLLGAAAALIGLVLFFGGNRFAPHVVAETYFAESVQGLEIGAQVRFRGVSIGRVSAILLARSAYSGQSPFDLRLASSRLVMVRYRLDPEQIGGIAANVPKAVPLGLRAKLSSQGLTGLTYLELDFVDPTQNPPMQVPWRPRDLYIPSVPSTIAQVQDAAQRFLARLDQIDLVAMSAGLQALLGELRDEFHSGDAQQALAQTTATLRTVQIAIAAADLPGLAADLRASSSAVRDLAQGQQTRALLAATASAANRLAATADRLPPLVAALTRTAQRTDATAADVQQALAPTLRDIRAAGANLRDTSEALRRDPGQILFGAPPPPRPTR